MRIVISHLNFEGFAGTESYMLTVARQLERLGHESVIYASRLGPVADFARGQGLRVTGSPDELPATCDGVLAQDAATAYELAGRYPQAPRIFVMHSRFPLQSPPRLAGVCSAIVVMNDRLGRRAEHLAGDAEVVRLRQPIDLIRFGARRNRRSRERPRVLVLSNYPHGARERTIEQACREAGLELSWIGGVAQVDAHPERAIGGADIIVSLGRGALEAMAAGCAAYILGPSGGDGWVTEEAYPAMESDGFSGRATAAIVDLPRLRADLAGFTERMGDVNRDLVWAHHDDEHHALALLELMTRHGHAEPRSVQYTDELARLVRMEWHEYSRVQSVLSENQAMRAELEALRERSGGLDLQLAETDVRLQTLLNLRRFRLVTGIARPFDRLRARFLRG